MRLVSKINNNTKSTSLVTEEIVNVHLDYIEEDGYVWRYDEDAKKYYNTGICLKGERGSMGPRGPKGDDGLSAYLIAKSRGFEGTAEQWLDSLKGKSAFEIAVENGFDGTLEEWFAEIVNEDITGKENKLTIVSASGTTLSPTIGNYYLFSSDVNTLTITLPSVTSDYIEGFMIQLTTGSTPNITFNGTYSEFDGNPDIEANSSYEINCIYNSLKWIISIANVA